MATTSKNSKRPSGTKQVRGGALSRLFSGKDDGNAETADWASVAPDTILDLISAITAAHGAVRFGYSRDGGAYSLGIYLDDESETLYFKPYEDVTAKLRELTERVRDLD